MLVLEDAVLNPRKLKALHEIPKGFVQWDTAYRPTWMPEGWYWTARGNTGALMRFLPEAIWEKALWEYKMLDGKPHVLRRWMTGDTKLIVNWQDPAAPAKKPADVFENHKDSINEGIDDGKELQERNLDGKSAAELCAFVNSAEESPETQSTRREPGPSRRWKSAFRRP